jgi:hypothetical protein
VHCNKNCRRSSTTDISAGFRRFSARDNGAAGSGLSEFFPWSHLGVGEQGGDIVAADEQDVLPSHAIPSEVLQTIEWLGRVRTLTSTTRLQYESKFSSELLGQSGRTPPLETVGSGQIGLTPRVGLAQRAELVHYSVAFAPIRKCPHNSIGSKKARGNVIER